MLDIVFSLASSATALRVFVTEHDLTVFIERCQAFHLEQCACLFLLELRFQASVRWQFYRAEFGFPERHTMFNSLISCMPCRTPWQMRIAS